MGCSVQQLFQVLLPYHCPGVCSMPVGLFADRNQHKFPIAQLFTQIFRNSQLRRIDKVIRRVDPHHRRRNLFHLLRRIVIRDAFT